MRDRGQALIIEAIILVAIAAFTIIAISRLAFSPAISGYMSYREYAEQVLSYLVKNDMIYDIVYGDDMTGNPSLARGVLNQLIPEELGYNLTVISVSLVGDKVRTEKLWSVSENFVEDRSSSAVLLLPGYRGEYAPRIVVLRVSG